MEQLETVGREINEIPKLRTIVHVTIPEIIQHHQRQSTLCFTSYINYG